MIACSLLCLHPAIDCGLGRVAAICQKLGRVQEGAFLGGIGFNVDEDAVSKRISITWMDGYCGNPTGRA
jgi:hypothetical protein